MAPEQERATAVPAASQAQPRPSPPAQAQQAIDLAGALGMHVLKRLAPRWPAWCSGSSWAPSSVVGVDWQLLSPLCHGRLD
jgi:hypothetical protein